MPMATFFRQWIARVRAFLAPRGPANEFDQELALHLEMLEQDYIRRGMSPEVARRAARVELGGLAQLREAHRAIRGLPFLESFLQDLRYALRMLSRSPAFAAIAVCTLAVGLGVNTAVFKVYDAALRPMQASQPDRLLQITHKGRTQDRFFSQSVYLHLRDNNRTFSGFAATTAGSVFSLADFTAPARVPGSSLADAAGIRFPRIVGTHPLGATAFGVTGNYFAVLGVGVAMGRTILPEDNSAAAAPVTLVSFNFWDERCARDPHMLGRRLNLDGVSVTVVGITPRDFSGTLHRPPDLWLPLALQERLIAASDSPHFELYGRLRSGIDPRTAEAEVNALARQEEPTGRRPRPLTLTQASPNGPPAANEAAGEFVMLAPFGLLLLIACANVASLLLARSAARRHEIAVRLAIGASRARLVRQLLTESAVVSLLAAAAGLALSEWLIHFLVRQITLAMLSPGIVPLHAAPSPMVLAYSLFLALASAFGCGLAPAMEASRPNLSPALKDEGTAFGGVLRKTRLRDLMLATQVSVCLLLLIAAGMLVRVSQRMLAFDLGFDYRGIVYLRSYFHRPAPPAVIAARRTALARELQAMPAVQSVSAAMGMPLLGGFGTVAVSPDGAPLDQSGARNSLVNLVAPEYFATMGIPILRGRNFTPQETRIGFNFESSPVIVSESAARRFWPGQDPIGKTVAVGSPGNSRRLPRTAVDPHSSASTVIGIARNVRSTDLHSSGDTCLLYFPESAPALGTILFRVRGEEGAAESAIQRALEANHSDLEAEMGDSRVAFINQGDFAAARLAGIASSILGMLGLLMASVGIYGTVAFAVTRRTQEIGIRMALGAKRRSVLRLVLWETMRPVAAGLAVGFGAAAVLSRLMRAFLFGLSALDPVAFFGVTAFLAAAALVAAYLPARRATGIDPVIALRYE